MIKIKRPVVNKTITTEMTLAGETFEIDLLPITEDERLDVFKPFRKRRNVNNPITKQMEIVTYFDDNDPGFRKAADDLLCKVIANFRGIGDEKGLAIDGSLKENKLLLGSVKVQDIEEITVMDENNQTAVIKQPRQRYFRALILDKAVELSEAAVETEIKNS
jgi:hypothetical protein